MISNESPLKRIPKDLGLKDAFYLDGLKHAAEICDLAFKRLTTNLFGIAKKGEETLLPESFSYLFLDAWAFVDSADRFRCLVLMRNRHLNNGSHERQINPNLNEELKDISEIRNVSAHIAQRADHVISSNGAALGTLSWVTMTAESPMSARTCFIRPGYANGKIKSKLPTPSGEHTFVNYCASVELHAGNGHANLSNSYFSIARSVSAIEEELRNDFSKNNYGLPCSSNVFGSAELDFTDLEENHADTRES